MRHRRTLVVLACCLVAGATHGDDLHRELARELVDVMKLVEMSEQLREPHVLARCRTRKCDKDQLACMLKFDREDSADRFVGIATKEFNDDELRAAIEYFRTEVGEKHRQILRAEAGLGNASLMSQRSEDRAKMLAFLDTRAGYLLFTRAVLTNTSELNSWLRNQPFLSEYDCLPQRR